VKIQGPLDGLRAQQSS